MTGVPNERAGAEARITAADVRRSFANRGNDQFTVTYFARIIANVLTPRFYNAGWTANRVTALRTGLAVVALALLVVPLTAAHMAAAVGFYLVCVLDCVDGNLSRLRDSASYWGKFADGLSDALFVLFAALATGIGLALGAGDLTALAFGAGTTIFVVAVQMVRTRASFIREWMVRETGPLTAEDHARLAAPARIGKIADSVLVDGTFFATLCLFLPGGAEWYLTALVIVQVPTSLVGLIVVMRSSSAILRRGRTSLHAQAPAAAEGGK